jgi:two-component system chemotaxis sensor kinase CheA
VEVASEIYALPLRSVLETARIQPEQVHRVEGKEVLRLRGETLPLLRLSGIFATKPTSCGRQGNKIVILGVGEKKIALLVDNLVAQESTVVKPMGSYLHHCSGVAGATISGDGAVRLVVDPAGLLSFAGGSNSEVSQGVAV